MQRNATKEHDVLLMRHAPPETIFMLRTAKEQSHAAGARARCAMAIKKAGKRVFERASEKRAEVSERFYAKSQRAMRYICAAFCF